MGRSNDKRDDASRQEGAPPSNMALNNPKRPLDEKWLCQDQPRLGAVGVIVLLGVLNAMCPMAIDMYTPAVPSLPEHFGTSEAMVNMTIISFVFVYTVGMLLFGPVSDRVGRKPVLVGGVGAFAAGSLLCAVSWNVGALIVFRVIQAAGAGAVSAVCIALVKDCFKPEKRTQVLSVLQVLMVIGPVIAPLLGGFIMRFASWRIVFIVLACVGAATFAMSLLFSESLPADEKVTGGLGESLRHLVNVASNKEFMLFSLVISLFTVPYMAYVGVASYVYVDHFGTTEQVYSYYFAVTALIGAGGPSLFLFVSRWVSKRRCTHIILGFCFVEGLVLLVAGSRSVWVFFALLALFILVEATIRPYGTDILLSLVESDTGSASSLVNFIENILGVIGMGLVTVLPFSYTFGIGVLMMVSMGAAIIVWAAILRSRTLRIPAFDE